MSECCREVDGNGAEGRDALPPRSVGVRFRYAQTDFASPPSLAGSLLTGAGGILGSPNGPQLGGSLGLGRFLAPTPSMMLGPYTGGDSASSGIFSDAANGI